MSMVCPFMCLCLCVCVCYKITIRENVMAFVIGKTSTVRVARGPILNRTFPFLSILFGEKMRSDRTHECPVFRPAGNL